MKKLLCIFISLLFLLNAFCFINVFAVNSMTDSENKLISKDKSIFIEDLIGAVEGENDGKLQHLTEQMNILKAVYPELYMYNDLKSQVTRAEFLKMLIGLIADGNYPEYYGFNDVDTKDSKLLEYLGYSVETGIVSKTDSFRPDDAITYNEMFKMAVVACGYEIAAQSKGGWPFGYLGIANQMGFMDFLENSNGIATADDTYRLLYNVVTVSLLEQTTFGKEEDYQINKGSSFLSDKYNVKVIEGIEYSNHLTSLTRELSAKGKPTITIGAHTFENKTDTDFLGYNVRAFIINENGRDTIISIRKYNNTEVFISNFSGVENYTIKGVNDNRKVKQYKLFKGYSILLNDIATPNIKLSDYAERDDVTLRLIDNNNDGYYDVVKIYTWKYMQVGKVNTVEKLIISKDVSNELLNLSDEDIVCKIFDCSNGVLNEISLEDLAQDDILTYVISNNRKSALIFRSNVKLTGIYSAFDSSENVIYVDDKEYSLSAYAHNNYQYLTLGKITTFSLDATGIIVAATQEDSGYRYGWIVNSAPRENSFEQEIVVKIFDQSGEMKIVPVARKLYVDNAPMKESEFYTLEQGLSDNRLVKYGLNIDGELNMVDFPSVFAGSLPFAENMSEKDCFTEYYSGSYEKLGNGSFGDAFMADSSTLFFSVPTTDRLNDELYLIKSYGNFRNGYVTVKAYDMALGASPKVVLTFSNTPAIAMDEYTGAEVVVDIRNARDEDDGFRKQIQTYNGAQYNKYFIRDGLDMSAVQLGDIIRISTYKNEIYAFNIDYSFSTNSLAAEVMPGSGQGRHVYYRGYVYGFGSRMMQIWDTMNINSSVSLDKIYGLDFSEQSVVFVDVYKNPDGSVADVMARYKPLTEIREFVNTGAEADFIVARMQDGSSVKKWIYRVVE